MHRIHLVARSSRRASLLSIPRQPCPPRAFFRSLHTQYEDKYSEKLRKAAEERGLSVDELKAKIKHEQEEQKRLRRSPPPPDPAQPASSESAPFEKVRKDSSPVKPLSSILNIPRILASPHTPEQISALWTVYHASRSNGTGRGYLCGSIPLDLYTRMASTAGKYPIFVVPVRRDKDPAAEPVEGQADAAHEFYFLQWAFHEAPPIPSLEDDLFFPPSAKKSTPASAPNPQASTVMFTPLQEYKMRGSFATPYLVLTIYTDLARSHDVVLLRGEITPAAAAGSAGVDGRYLLQQDDAHRLSMSVNKFYLWDTGMDDGSPEREKLVKAFHETPDQFEWEELLKHAI
ncbi:ATP11 protein-domain-containing protein [Mycena rosella]|uniref:ATP11 protein-domain-containing protein n=1 Tax=Mycena rosella TaxID=1033263 RepID=A0AAD7GLL9_MYCRO|nr:ATP11 protein-domain-containing protein [Mycena rosella]